MICSLLIDFLVEARAILGVLPRTLVIQADNTYKETKNTITIWGAIWLMLQLEGTRLEAVEFVFLLVWHAHDIVGCNFRVCFKSAARPRRPVCGGDVRNPEREDAESAALEASARYLQLQDKVLVA